MTEHVDNLVIGGGAYGAHIALALAEERPSETVALLESNDELFGGASTHNHSRLHRGYLYPRDIGTALQSKHDAVRFVADYGQTVQETRGSYYGIHKNSLVSSEQYRAFCDEAGLPYELVGRGDLFGEDIEAVFEVPEATISLQGFKRMVLNRLEASSVEVRPNTQAVSITEDDNRVIVGIRDNEPVSARNVFNCTYSQTNGMHLASGLPVLPMTNDKYVLFGIDLPKEMESVSATVMYGPYGSLVANDNWGTHVLAHVEHSNVARTANVESTEPDDQDDIRRRAAVALYESQKDLLPLKDAVLTSNMVRHRAVLGDTPENGVRGVYTEAEYGGIPGYNVVLGGKMTGFYNAVDFALEVVAARDGAQQHVGRLAIAAL
jgi:glycine/D-amino acid oxidase-like deaminating enzyme